MRNPNSGRRLGSMKRILLVAMIGLGACDTGSEGGAPTEPAYSCAADVETFADLCGEDVAAVLDACVPDPDADGCMSAVMAREECEDASGLPGLAIRTYVVCQAAALDPMYADACEWYQADCDRYSP